MKRYLIFSAMFLFSLPDFLWGAINLVQAALLYALGKFLDRIGKDGELVSLYGRNIALSIDQFMATKALGQDPDVSISMALGVAKAKFAAGDAYVSGGWLMFGELVNKLFGFQEDHIIESIEIEESAEHTIIKVHESFPPSEFD